MLQESNDCDNENVDCGAVIQNITTTNKTHTAGLDAFMTGYVMLNYLNKFSKFERKNSNESSCSLEQFVNLSEFNFSVYLSGKDYPLIVKKSNFASTSLNHQEKKQRTAGMSTN